MMLLAECRADTEEFTEGEGGCSSECGVLKRLDLAANVLEATSRIP